MDKVKIERINELARKKKTAGLTEEDRDLITVNPYETLVSQYDASLTGKAILATAEALGTDFGEDDELKAMILDYYGAEEE